MHPAAADIVHPLLAKVDAVVGEGYSAIIYGSAVRGGYRPGQSDLNLLLIFDTLGTETVRSLGPALEAHERAGHTPPLLFSRAEWVRAADAFPIEITDMRQATRVLRGTDPLVGLTVDPADLRRALEREFRGKLLRLRQAYAVFARDEAALGRIAAGSLGTVRLLARSVLALQGRAVPDAKEVLAVAAAALGIDGAGWTRTAARVAESDPPTCPADLFGSYLGTLELATGALDTLQPGDA